MNGENRTANPKNRFTLCCFCLGRTASDPDLSSATYDYSDKCDYVVEKLTIKKVPIAMFATDEDLEEMKKNSISIEEKIPRKTESILSTTKNTQDDDSNKNIKQIDDDKVKSVKYDDLKRNIENFEFGVIQEHVTLKPILKQPELAKVEVHNVEETKRFNLSPELQETIKVLGMKRPDTKNDIKQRMGVKNLKNFDATSTNEEQMQNDAEDKIENCLLQTPTKLDSPTTYKLPQINPSNSTLENLLWSGKFREFVKPLRPFEAMAIMLQNENNECEEMNELIRTNVYNSILNGDSNGDDLNSNINESTSNDGESNYCVANLNCVTHMNCDLHINDTHKCGVEKCDTLNCNPQNCNLEICNPQNCNLYNCHPHNCNPNNDEPNNYNPHNYDLHKCNLHNYNPYNYNTNNYEPNNCNSPLNRESYKNHETNLKNSQSDFNPNSNCATNNNPKWKIIIKERKESNISSGSKTMTALSDSNDDSDEDDTSDDDSDDDDDDDDES